MKLKYRGVNYEYNPTVVEATEAEVAGKYRGLDWRFHNLKKPPIIQPALQLTYRGVKYNKANSDTTNSGYTSQPTTEVTVKEKARYLMINHAKQINNRRQSMLTRLTNEIHP